MHNFGIVCDVDGVLLKGGIVIDRVSDAFHLLENSEKNGFICPMVFVTNGGDQTETGKGEALAHKFLPFINKQHMIVSHSPLQAIDQLRNERLLLVGRNENTVLQIAKEYRWENFDTLQNVIREHPYLTPGRKLTPGQPIPATRIHERMPFDSIIILSSPTNWEEGLQVIIDFLCENVKLYVANLDFVYSAEYVVPRFTTGAFIKCLECLYQGTTGKALDYVPVGKPFLITYSFAEDNLNRQFQDSTQLCKTIYAIGDNPLSDIKGANEAGDQWFSILVQTGCASENHPEIPAKLLCYDFMDAVQFILQREGLLEHTGNAALVSSE